MNADLQSVSAASADAYLAAWKSLRNRRRGVALGLLVWVPTAIIGASLGPNPLAAFVPMPAFATFLITMGRLCLFACPRCGDAFGAKNWVWGPWSPSVFVRRECFHCGITVGTPKG